LCLSQGTEKDDSDDDDDNDDDDDHCALPPLPMSQYSFYEKRKLYERVDAVIDTALTRASQNYATLLAILPTRNDFTTSKRAN
jgi:hypothetical protein